MKKTIVLATLLAANFSMANHQEQIVDFVYKRDIEDVLKIMHDDWNWLFKSDNPDYDPEYALQNEIPNEKLSIDKKLEMKVLREEKLVVGFITFYKEENSDTARIRLLSIAQDFKETGCDEKLVVSAINHLFDSGCTSVYLFTYKNNEKVDLYKSLGFEEVEISQETISWYEANGISSEEYKQYMKCAVTKKTFKPA